MGAYKQQLLFPEAVYNKMASDSSYDNWEALLRITRKHTFDGKPLGEVSAGKPKQPRKTKIKRK